MNLTAGLNDIRAYLLRQDKEELVRLILEATERNEAMLNRLLLRIANAATGGPDISAIKAAINRTAEIDEYIEYAEAWDYADKLNDVVSSIRPLLTSGYAAEVIELAEYAVGVFERQIEYVDDSNGEVGGVLAEIERLHFDAYSQSSLPSEELGERLFDLELRSEYTFYEAFDTYVDVLGEAGIDAYIAKAKEAWEQLPPLNPGDAGMSTYGRQRVVRIMESLARRTGDVETYVGVLSKDLSTSYRFSTIVEAYQLAGDDAKAREWGERGFQFYPDLFANRLPDQLVSIYRDCNQHSEALDILWQRFEARPGLAYLQPIKDYTEPLQDWRAWHDRAFALMRKQVDAPVGTHVHTTTRAELILVFLWDGDAEAAWVEANIGDRLPFELWINVGGAREETHPEDSIGVYRRVMNQLVENTSNGDYQLPIDLLRKMRRLFRVLDQDRAFEMEIDRLRHEFKRKRNFMRDLDVIVKER